MKKRINIMVCMVLVVIIVVLGVRCYLIISQIDEVAPKIIFPEETTTFIEGEDSSVLLKDVKAIDGFDGDVSNTIIIEKILPYKKEQKAIVTYAAIDRSYNMVKASRSVIYKTTEGE